VSGFKKKKTDPLRSLSAVLPAVDAFDSDAFRRAMRQQINIIFQQIFLKDQFSIVYQSHANLVLVMTETFLPFPPRGGLCCMARARIDS
jgi:hypothetical protein